MRIGLAVTKVTRNTGRNLHAMLEFIDEAARNEADLVLFGEAAPTGLINNDDPCHDTAIAEPVPGGPTMNTLAQAAINAGIYVGTGILEKDGKMVPFLRRYPWGNQDYICLMSNNLSICLSWVEGTGLSGICRDNALGCPACSNVAGQCSGLSGGCNLCHNSAGDRTGIRLIPASAGIEVIISMSI